MRSAAKRLPDKRRAPARVEAAVPAVVQRGGSVDDVIERLLATPSKENVDLIERLLKLRAEQAFNVALRDVQEEIPRILRDAANDTTKSRYARLDTMAKAINPNANRKGFVLSFGTATSPLPNHYRVVCDLSHIAGHMRHYEVDVPADSTGMKGSVNKTPTHAMGSAMTYGRRYLMMLMFNLVLVNEDDDGNMGAIVPITSEQSLLLQNLIERTALTNEQFCEAYKINDVAALPEARFAEAHKRLLKREAEIKKREAKQ